MTEPSKVSPARAGIVPSQDADIGGTLSFPRTHGDSPGMIKAWDWSLWFPSHARG